MQKLNLFWFRRDLRLDDNAGLHHALQQDLPLLPIFIFDSDILEELDDKKDKRVSFIHYVLQQLQNELINLGSSLDVRFGKPSEVFKKLLKGYSIHAVYTNHDYEPYAKERDQAIKTLLKEKGILFQTFKDQVIFEKNEVVKDNNEAYYVFTPYSKKWLGLLKEGDYKPYSSKKFFKNFFIQKPLHLPSLSEVSFEKAENIPALQDIDNDIILHYHKTRNFPAVHGTSKLGLHLRFGTVSIRKIVETAVGLNATYLKELIWREFFMQMLWRNPRLINECYKKNYDDIKWRNNEKEFDAWCRGETGYPIVDAGMRELNETGFMHNRVRMITASFLVKHLLVDWRWGEAYFAKKLLDYELSSNNGNWQWVAGCCCDAAPYFRIFNPTIQVKKFDSELKYIRQWVPDLETFSYPKQIVEHEYARKRCLEVYKSALAR